MNPYQPPEEPIQAEVSEQRPWDLYDIAAVVIYLTAAAGITWGLFYW